MVLRLYLGKLEMFTSLQPLGPITVPLKHSWPHTPSHPTLTLFWQVFTSPFHVSRVLRAANLWPIKKLFMKLDYKSGFSSQDTRWLRFELETSNGFLYIISDMGDRENFHLPSIWPCIFAMSSFSFHCTRKYYLSTLTCIWMQKQRRNHASWV